MQVSHGYETLHTNTHIETHIHTDSVEHHWQLTDVGHMKNSDIA